MPTPTIVTRTSKGSPLTYAELDANFTNLRNAVGVGSTLTSDATVVTASSATTYNLTLINQIIFVNVTATSGTVELNFDDIVNHALLPYIIVINKASTGASVRFVLSGTGGLSLSNAMFDNESGTVVYDVIYDTLFYTGGLAKLMAKRRDTGNYPSMTGPTMIHSLSSSTLSSLSGYAGQIVINDNSSGQYTLQYWNGSSWANPGYNRVQTASINTAFDTSLAMDNLNVRIHTVSGSAGQLQASAVSGSFTAYVTTFGNISGYAVAGDTSASGITFTAGTWTSCNFRYNLSSGGDVITAHIMDYYNSRLYRVTAMHGNNTTGGFISIERMI